MVPDLSEPLRVGPFALDLDSGESRILLMPVAGTDRLSLEVENVKRCLGALPVSRPKDRRCEGDGPFKAFFITSTVVEQEGTSIRGRCVMFSDDQAGVASLGTSLPVDLAKIVAWAIVSH